VSIYVGNLSHQANKENLEEVFAAYGAGQKVALSVDRETGKLREFEFVGLETDEQENKASKR
jgi:RNA recognition motif-containing protein